MPNIFWPKSDIEEIRASSAQQQIDERLAQFERSQQEREALTAKPVAPTQPSASAWDFSSLRGTLMPWDRSQEQPPSAMAQQQPSAQPDAWDFSSLKPLLMPWAPQPEPAAVTPQGFERDFGSAELPGDTVDVPSRELPGFYRDVPPTGQAPAAGGDLKAYARQVAQQYGVDPDIFDRQINQESGYNPSARSPVGAAGIAQFMPGTAAQYGVNVDDPYSSLEGAARHMRDLLRANNGNYRFALAAYNAGQGNVDKYGEGVFGDDFANGQTRDYVNIILGPGASAGRQSSMNAGAALPSAPATPPSAAGPGGSSPPGPAVPPAVAQRWQERTRGAPMNAEDVAQLQALGVM